MIIELNVKDEKAETFISFLKELDFVKINSRKDEQKPMRTDASLESIVEDDEDLSDCITLEEFGNRLKQEVRKRYADKK